MMTEDIKIAIDGLELVGSLTIPADARGLVIFVHGHGSSRSSPRNRHVAHALHACGLATLLFDLLTVEEEEHEAFETTIRCDVDVVAERLISATDSVLRSRRVQGLPIGYFGSSTGAAAALIAAARRPAVIGAVVARGGRPDLAGAALSEVRAPTLLIVGSEDTVVLAANQEAARKLRAPHRVEVILGATHFFEEYGALDQVADAAATWFLTYFERRVPQAQVAAH